MVKWSDANFVEDQDQWWHGGITRSVYLYATDAVHIADLRADAGLADDLTTGTLDLKVTVDVGRLPLPGWTVDARLTGHGVDSQATLPVHAEPVDNAFVEWTRLDRDLLWRVGAGEPLSDHERQAWDRLHARLTPPLDGLARWQLRLPDILPWSAELPRLYDLAGHAALPRRQERRGDGHQGGLPAGGDRAAWTCSSTAAGCCSTVSTGMTSTPSTAAP